MPDGYSIGGGVGDGDECKSSVIGPRWNNGKG